MNGGHLLRSGFTYNDGILVVESLVGHVGNQQIFATGKLVVLGEVVSAKRLPFGNMVANLYSNFVRQKCLGSQGQVSFIVNTMHLARLVLYKYGICINF